MCNDDALAALLSRTHTAQLPVNFSDHRDMTEDCKNFKLYNEVEFYTDMWKMEV